jgi:MGT family glycosyltransferase
MAKIAFFGMSARGHFNQAVGVLQELQSAGHDVHAYAYQQGLPYLAEYGIAAASYEDVLGADLVRSPFERSPSAVASGVSMANPAGRREFFTTLTAEVLANVDGYIQLLCDLKPDVVIHTLMFPGPRYAAESLGLPLVTSGSMAISPKAWLNVPSKEVGARMGADFAILREVTAPLQELRGRLGLTGPANPVDVFNVSRDLDLAYTSQEFQGDWDTERPYAFVGPCPRERLGEAGSEASTEVAALTAIPGDGPLVFVSLGTQADAGPARAFLEQFIAAAGPMPARFVIATGATVPPDSLPALPPNIRAAQSVPQLELLPHVDAVVCQGGFNTVHEALFEAKPTWALMMDNDHFQVGGRLAASGAGIATLFRDGQVSADEIRTSLEALLQDQSLPGAAAKVRDSFLAAGGRKAAVGAIEQLLSRRG